jgi:hypothetical protein
MAAGIHYDDPFEVERELWNIKSTYRLMGGVNLDITGLTVGSKLPPLTPLAVDFSTRKAVVVKNVKVIEVAATGATSVKIQKGSLVNGAINLSDSTNVIKVSKIDTTNADYDVLTVTATTAGLAVGDVLTEATSASDATPKNTANFLNYARVKVESGATVTLVGQAYEIQEAELYLPISKADKVSLTSRFMFV